jgi:hypothetical protein
VADEDLITSHVESVDAQLATLLPPETGAVTQAGRQPKRAIATLDGVENEAYFLGCEDHRHTERALRPHAVDVGQLDAEHLAVEEVKGDEALVLSAGRDMAVDGLVAEELLDLPRTHVLGMAHAMKADEAFDPIDIALLGPRRVVADAHGTTESIKEFWRFGVGQLPQLDMQDALVEEVERLAGLVESTERVFLGLGEMLKETSDLGQAHVPGMAFVVKEDEASRPVGEALSGLGSAEVVEGGLTQLVEKARRLRHTGARIGRGCGIDHGGSSLP